MSDKPRISVLTASCRMAGLPMLADCLAAQTERSFEWLVCVPPDAAAPADLVAHLRARVPGVHFLADPPRRPGDFYRLNGAWNTLVRAARADLLVFACDYTWFKPDALELFHNTFLDLPDAIVSSWGNHYRKVVNDKPEVLWLSDQRLGRDEVGDDARMPTHWTELNLASMPRAKVVEVGGFDEEYDRVAGNSEKELAIRMAKVGCKCYLGFSIEHRIYTHPKSSSAAEWDKKYKESCALITVHAQEVEMGTRLKVPYLEGA